jgi:hypothetical protein
MQRKRLSQCFPTVGTEPAMLDPDPAYSFASWADFLSAEVQASAALTGLLFVAISINLKTIVSEPLLVPRAAKGLTSLVGVMVAASLCLVPGQHIALLGSELTILGAIVWWSVTGSHRAASRNNPHITNRQRFFQAALTQLSAIPFVISGVTLMCHRGGGFYWLVPAVIISLVAALMDSWVLLIEIMR